MANPEESARGVQEIYARWLAAIVRVGFVALVASFLVYVANIVPPGIPFERLPELWHLPYTQYIAQTGSPTGWSWVHRLGESDLLNFVGVAILGAATILCHLRVLPAFVRARERAYVGICIAEIVVLGAAASGLIFR